MKTALVHLDYQGFVVDFNEDGWFNATAVSAHFGKLPNDWLEQGETAEYIAALLEFQLPGQTVIKEIQQVMNGKIGRATHNQLLRLVKKTGLVKTRAGAPETGGGTWLHPKLAVPFARWCDVRFAIWCDIQIEGLIKGQHPHFDWQRLRHASASSNKVMNAVLQLQRQLQNRPVASYHFINEARLVNWALTGEFKGLDRDRLTVGELDALAKLEERNTVLIGCALGYEERKAALKQLVREWSAMAVPALDAPA